MRSVYKHQQGSRTPAKGSSRSRIPRPVLRPYGPRQSPFSEEETPGTRHSSESSKITVSTNSCCSDDTGCPRSQLTSPSVADRSLGSTTVSDRKRTRKKVRVMGESSTQLPSRKADPRRAGADEDFSPSGGIGSSKPNPSSPTSPAVKRPTYSHSRGALGRRAGTSPKLPAGDLEPCAPCRAAPHIPHLDGSCGSSSSARRGYHSCWDNHGIKAPSPEQYLTPLQQKEVVIRHLRSQVLQLENRNRKREMEVEDLKAQLGRMQEDWVEEECHRVEAQLALKEARKEIKQLRLVVETMRNSLAEKDKGIQKYFIDINIQNRKLEALLRSMELAQSGGVQEEAVSSTTMLEVQEAHEMTDSGLHISDEGVDLEDGSGETPSEHLTSVLEGPVEVGGLAPDSAPSLVLEEKSVQTDPLLGPPDLQALLFHLLKLREAGVTLSPEPTASAPADREPAAPEPVAPPGGTTGDDTGALVSKRYWSSNFFVDLAALAVPMLPTVAWLYCTHRASTEPVYNIGVLIRGCCMVGLRSLRHMSLGAGV